MPLFARNLQELTTSALEDLSTNTNLTKLTPGGKARALLDAVNKRLEQTYETFDLNLARAFVSAAPGQFLDLIGELLGVKREAPSASNAPADLQLMKFFVESGNFGAINNSQNIIIPAGTIISTAPNSTGILYKTIDDALLFANDSVGYFGVEAIVPGETSNVGTGSMVYHGFTQYADFFNNTLKVTNLSPISNGRNLETDPNYRYRIVNRVLEAEAGNETAIRLAVLSTPGVANVLLLPFYRGIGTFGAVIQSTGPTVTDSLIDEVSARVELVKSMGDLAIIRKPREIGLTMRLTVHYNRNTSDDEIEVIESELDTAIRTFIAELDLGEPFIMNKMVAELFEVSDAIANFGEPNRPIDEIYVYIESKTGDGRVKQLLLEDYYAEADERVIIEPSVSVPIVLEREFARR